MPEVIGSAAYQLILDTTEFEKGATLTRKETTALRRTLREIETPAEKHQKKLKDLGTLYQKGAIDADQLKKAIDKLEREQRDASRSTEDLTDEQKDLNDAWGKGQTSILTFNAALDIAREGWQLMQSGVEAVFEYVDRIDDLAKFTESLGISASEFSQMSYAVRQLGGIDGDQFRRFLVESNKRLQEARRGTGEAIDGLEKLGISAKDLSKDPLKAVQQLIGEIGKIETASERAEISQRLFGEEAVKMSLVAEEGLDAVLQKMNDIRQAGGALTGEDLKAAQEFSDAWDDAVTALGMLRDQALAEILPDLTEAILELNASLKEIDYKEWRELVTDLVYVAKIIASGGVALDYVTTLPGRLFSGAAGAAYQPFPLEENRQTVVFPSGAVQPVYPPTVHQPAEPAEVRIEDEQFERLGARLAENIDIIIEGGQVNVGAPTP